MQAVHFMCIILYGSFNSTSGLDTIYCYGQRKTILHFKVRKWKVMYRDNTCGIVWCSKFIELVFFNRDSIFCTLTGQWLEKNNYILSSEGQGHNEITNVDFVMISLVFFNQLQTSYFDHYLQRKVPTKSEVRRSRLRRQNDFGIV